jgi:hypothetical protein
MAISGFSFNQTDVSVTAGQVTSVVDLWLTMTPPSPSAIVMGKVIDAGNGKSIADATVSAQGAAGSGSTETDSNGNYVISSGLGTGTYTVTASAPGYQTQSKTGISLTVNVVTSGVDFQLSILPPQQSGTITGTVTGAPNPIPEFEYPVAVALFVTLVAVVATKLVMRTKRLRQGGSRL